MKRANRVGVPVMVVAVVGLMIAPAAQAKIVVGQSIAGVKLGMSQAQVKTILGTPSYQEPPDRQGNISWGYTRAPLDGRVSFNKQGQVYGMWTISRQQKTNKGVGVGSSLAKVKRAYPGIKCSVGPFGPQSLICGLKSKYHGRTVETSFPFFYRTAGAREVDIGFA